MHQHRNTVDTVSGTQCQEHSVHTINIMWPRAEFIPSGRIIKHIGLCSHELSAMHVLSKS